MKDTKKNTKGNVLPSIKDSFSDWYNDAIEKANLCDHSSVKGCITILPYGYAIWENIQKELDAKIKEMNVKNMAFPLLFPYKLLEKEKDHVEGFAPEVAVVTHAGGEKLEENLVIRPTSEVIIHSYFKKWIRSWRDLPVKVNQWCSVVRWEKRPRPFIRTTEFWWQEGHTAHATIEEAEAQAYDSICLYRNFCENVLAIPVIMAKKPQYERFAGADITWTIEGMMQDGKALQMGTSHLLNKGFVDSLEISFQDKGKGISFPTLTSWGVTTRLIGALIMVHGDDFGIVIPPKIAPILIVIVPIFKNDLEKSIVLSAVSKITVLLKKYNFAFELDDREEVTPGAKFYESEIRGVPFRFELGMRDIEKDQFTIFIRDIRQKENFLFENLDNFNLLFDQMIDCFQKRLYDKALQNKNEKTFYAEKLEQFVNNGFYITHWCGKDENKFKLESQLSVRCVLEDNILNKTCCIHENCSQNLLKIVLAKSY